LVAINPKQALALLEYRSARLLAARIRATTHGFRGAM
jgi:trehalose/maltose hydrolase-like predicted phosphorylase